MPLKRATGYGKTRFIAVEFDYLQPELETAIVAKEAGADNATGGSPPESAAAI